MLVAEVGEKTRKHGIVLRANVISGHLLAQICYCIAGCLQHKMLVKITNLLCLSHSVLRGILSCSWLGDQRYKVTQAEQPAGSPF